MKDSNKNRLRTPLLIAAGVRIVIGLLAIPLAPVLYKDHFLILVLMRPTKEVLLAGGFLLRQDKVGLIELMAAAIPLAILGVWHFYYLGRIYCEDIGDGNMPKLAQRILPPDRIRKLQKVLDKKGPRLVFLGRIAAFPSALVGAAAGSGDMASRQFLPADGLGALVSIAEVVGAGYLAGEAYKKAGPLVTGAGVAVLIAGAVLLGRYLRRE
ncbi:MAG TPA: VTT domain-containing protein [Actinomycetota bacterium]|nr:VTT domain-containing protein [Actinomycetota bacterium]